MDGQLGLDMKERELIAGYQALRELLTQNPGSLQEIWLHEGKNTARAREIIALAERAGIRVCFKSNREFSTLLPGIRHQGFVGVGAPFEYVGLEELFTSHLARQGERLILALDHITDEGNLGSVIRTAAFFGAHGLIIPQRRSAKVSAKVIKLASGAHVHLPICQVVNLSRALERFKRTGYWIVGTSDKGGIDIFEFDWKMDVVLVLGNEQKGMGHAVRKICHEVVSIPRGGDLESLNVGVAAGVVMAEIFRQRKRVGV